VLSAIELSAGGWLAAGGAILFAAVLRGFTGFGFALAAVPLASLVLPPSRTVAAVLVMQLAVGLRDCVMEWRQADRRGVGLLSLGAAAGLPLGVAALALTPAPLVRAALGLLVLVAVALTWRPRPAAGVARAGVTAGTGFVSGMFHGLAAMGGPPAVAYFLAYEPRVAVMRSSLMVYFPIVSLLGLPMVHAAGLLDQAAIVLGLAGMPLMIGGGWLGAWAFRRFGTRSYRPLALGALLVTAAASIARAVVDLF
jgi:uncharacterized membrane protein YfcA